MDPLRADLTYRVGDTWVGPIWAVVLNGAAVDLTTGWVVRAQARLRPDSDPPVFTWSAPLGRVLLATATVTLSGGATLTTSTVQLTHTAAGSAAVAPFTGVYDCEISKAGEVHTITAGRVTAVGDVTR